MITKNIGLDANTPNNNIIPNVHNKADTLPSANAQMIIIRAITPTKYHLKLFNHIYKLLISLKYYIL